MSDRISLIIPVYNVAPFLHPCIQSVLAQTHQELEILLVNDGSTDDGPAICDRYALLDDRIQVIHKANGGLSDARNAGLDRCHGDWVFFLDADDTLGSTDYLSALCQAAHTANAQIAISNTLTITETGEPRAHMSTTAQNGCVLNKVAALQALLYCRLFQLSAWGKLYRADLFNGIRFPDRLLYEDLPTTYRLFLQITHAVCAFEVDYCYRVRAGSIMAKPVKPYLLDLAESVWTNVKRLCPAAEPAAFDCYFRRVFVVATQNWALSDAQQKARYLHLLRTQHRRYFADPEVSLFHKAEIVAFLLSPPLLLWARQLGKHIAQRKKG